MNYKRINKILGTLMIAGLGGFIATTVLSAKKMEGLSSVQTGKQAPNFTLTDTMGKSHQLQEYKGKFVVLEWINYGCPFVKKHYGSNNMQTLQKEYVAKGVVWLSVSSSAKGKEGFMKLEEWNDINKEKGNNANAVLLDSDGVVGRLYGAKTTPHMYIVNPEGILIYQGAIDDHPSTEPKDIPVSKNYVRIALDEAMAGKPVSVAQTDPYGCSVKYK